MIQNDIYKYYALCYVIIVSTYFLDLQNQLFFFVTVECRYLEY